jgi:transposase
LKKLLTDASIHLSVVVSDLYGKSANAMITGLLDGETPEQLLSHDDSCLKATPDTLREALDGDLSDSHRFVIRELMTHIDELEARSQRFRQVLLSSLRAYQVILQTLQTQPAINELSA